MRIRTATEIGGAAIGLGTAIFARAKLLAEIIGIVHLPNDIQELLMKASETPTFIVVALLFVGLSCIAFLIYDTIHPPQKECRIMIHWRLRGSGLLHFDNAMHRPKIPSSATQKSKSKYYPL